MITPKNWSSFQHYKQRRPPWIKLHRTLLDDMIFQRLHVASRALAPMLWLLASEYTDGIITLSNEDVAFRLRMPIQEFLKDLKPLVEKGFFACEQGTSIVLAPCKQNHLLESETEIEKKDAAEEAAQGKSEEGKFFERGREVLGQKAGGLLRLLLEAKGRDVVQARLALELAATKGDPKEYIGGILRNGGIGSAII